MELYNSSCSSRVSRLYGSSRKTFYYTPEGPIGPLTDKKVALLNANGGVYSEGPGQSVEMAVRFVKHMLNFWGVLDTETIIVEGHNHFPYKSVGIIVAGLEKAASAAKEF